MPKTTELPTWEIRPTADGNFQWTAANAAESGVQFGPPLKTLACGEENQSGTLLPSMADLLTLARTKVLEGADGDGNGGGFPMFRTGTGRSVRLSESSVRKARSVLRGADDTNIENEAQSEVGIKGSFPLFSTDYEITMRESSIREAAAIVENEDMHSRNEAQSNVGPTCNEFPLFCTGSGKLVAIRESSIRKATAILEGKTMNDVNVAHSGVVSKENGFPLFSTGSRKSITVGESSIMKAAAILEGNEMDNGSEENSDFGTKDNGFRRSYTGFGKSPNVRDSSTRKAEATLEENNMNNRNEVHSNVGHGFSVFCTESRRMPTVRDSSTKKAATIFESKDIDSGIKAHLDGNTKDNGFPSFFTGSGKSVTVRESSIRKAAAILESRDMKSGNEAHSEASNKDYGFSLFSTGSGKSVTVRESSIKKAAAILEGKNANNDVSTKDYGFPLFSTGSGKSVTVEESSIRKAAAILQGKDMNNSNEAHTNFSTKDDFPLFSTGSGKSVTVKESSIKKATAILEGNNMTNGQFHEHTVGNNCTFFNPIFQTGSGTTVNVSSSSLAKATTLLGLEEDKKIYTLGCFEQTRTETSTKISMGGSLHENFSPDKNGYTASTFIVDRPNVRWVQRSPSSFLKTVCATGNHSNNDQLHKTLKHTVDSSYHTHSPVKYHTASGQYNSISNNALTRARRLLGDSDIGVIEDNLMPDHSCLRNKNNHVQTSWNKEKFSSLYSPNCEGKSDQVYRTPPSISKRKEPSSLYCKNKSEGYMLDQENARNFPLGKNYSGKKLYLNQKPVESILAHNAVESRTEDGMPLGRPLVDISNIIAADCMDVSPLSSKKRQSGKMSSFSQFKRPRSSRFITPLKSGSFLATGSSKLSTTQSSCCSKIFNNYPFQLKRMNIKDFFGCSPVGQDLSWSLPPEVRNMDADNALTYRFPDTYDHNEIGTEAFQDMLLQCGASSCNATKEWVANHYRWIVWKFACYERCYPTILRSKLLTVSNVVEELKYRYEREVNHGHRSAIKKILDGDASPATMMVLCVSAIRSTQSQMSKFDDINCSNGGANEVSNSCSTVEKGTCDTIIELTDGWYSLDALPDVCLSKQLVAGKLFVGQKLRIWGAGLCGWAGPISSLEASKTVRLLMHINGTYRAHWDDKLGFCRSLGAPLAFKCIKVAGGKVPRTLVGITRIYPVLYRERFPDGGHIVRSERLEKKALQKYNQRRCNIVEAIMSEQIDVVADMNDSDEGAKLYEILEVAAEPEVLMADMTSEQLFSFSAYQAKQKDVRQMDMQKKIEKALKDAGLVSREVTPFMRVRVVGLTSKHSCRKGGFREGMITIWNPTEEQRVDLVEGKIYDVAGLMPINCSMDVLYLQSSGSSTVWKSLPSWKAEKYEPFFNPRKSVTLSNLAVIPLASEFDIAAIILHVEDSCVSGHQKKQWIFVSDGCNCSSTSQSREQHDCLLAISFSSPIDNDSSALFSHHHEGTVVGFFNLIKRVRDQTNHLWVAEGTENSTHSACYNLPKRCHLKEEATSAQRWAKTSYLTIQKLKERILHILGHRET